MAATRFAYVKTYEAPDPILPNTYFVVRIDGQSFHRFTDDHKFEKPNDLRGLKLMDKAAEDVMRNFPDIALAFGESDEFSFLFKRSCRLYNRRQSKILTSVVSQFTSSYVFHWASLLPETPLQYPPTFDGRLVVYPTEKEVKDYFAWRQADTHINNLYNTTFWALVQQGGMSTTEAHERLKGTVSSDKNEILFNQFGINYNTLPERYRKGSVLLRSQSMGGAKLLVEKPSEVTAVPNALDAGEQAVGGPSEGGSSTEPMIPAAGQGGKTQTNAEAERIARKRLKKQEKKDAKRLEKEARTSTPEWKPVVLHCDVIEDKFWAQNPHILS